MSSDHTVTMATEDNELSIRSRHGLLRDLAPIYSLYQLLPNLIAVGLFLWLSHWLGYIPPILILVLMLGWVFQFVLRPSLMIVSTDQAAWLEAVLEAQGFFAKSETDARWRMIEREWWQRWPHQFIEFVPGDTVSVIAPREVMEALRGSLELMEEHRELWFTSLAGDDEVHDQPALAVSDTQLVAELGREVGDNGETQARPTLGTEFSISARFSLERDIGARQRMTFNSIAVQPPPLVEEALTCEPGKAATLIARFTTAGELDHFGRRYNANDGFEPLRCVLRHPECDAGTALFIYWRFHEMLDDPETRTATQTEPAQWNADALLTEIEQRYPHDFHHRRFACDPATDCAQILGEDYVQGIRARMPGSPLMEPLAVAADAS